MSRTSSSPAKRTVIADYGPSGEIICKCKEPVVEFITKKEGPNTGRKFFRCSKDQTDDTKCKVFYWEDEVKPPTLAQLSKFESYHRLGDGTSPSPPSTPKASGSNSSPSKRKASSQSIVILSDDDDEEWAKADEELQAESNRKSAREKRLNNLNDGMGMITPNSSPTKKIKSESGGGNQFNSFSSPSSSSKSNTSSSSQFQSILDDPDNPFHKVQQSLFGSNSISASTSQQQHLLESPTTPSSSQVLNGSFDEIITTLSLLKKEDQKKERLLNTAKKRTDFLVGQIDKLKGELEVASNKARLLQEENEELRSRYE